MNSKVLYLLAADAILLLHALFVAFVIMGLLLNFCRQIFVLVVGAESVVSLGASHRHRGSGDSGVVGRYLPADNLGIGASLQSRRLRVYGLVYCALVGGASLLSGS